MVDVAFECEDVVLHIFAHLVDGIVQQILHRVAFLLPQFADGIFLSLIVGVDDFLNTVDTRIVAFLGDGDFGRCIVGEHFLGVVLISYGHAVAHTGIPVPQRVGECDAHFGEVNLRLRSEIDALVVVNA